MKKLIFILFILFILGYLLGQENSTDSTVYSTYTGNYELFKISYPANWFINKTTKEVNVDFDSDIRARSMESIIFQNSEFRYSDSSNVKYKNHQENILFEKSSMFSIQIDHLPDYFNITSLKDYYGKTFEGKRLDNIIKTFEIANIGGKSIEVQYYKKKRKKRILFVFKDRMYTIIYASGSRKQFKKDREFFQKMLESFMILD